MVQGLAFLSKKSWHTKNLANQEKVWMAEQRKAAEASKTKELARQIQQEREQEELEKISGKRSTTIDRGIDWMYQNGAANTELAKEDAAKRSEEYLLGKEFAGDGGPVGDFAQEANQNQGINKIAAAAAASASASAATTTDNNTHYGHHNHDNDDDEKDLVKERNESFRLRVEDPMFMVQQKTREKINKAEQQRALVERVVGPITSHDNKQERSRKRSGRDNDLHDDDDNSSSDSSSVNDKKKKSRKKDKKRDRKHSKRDRDDHDGSRRNRHKSSRHHRSRSRDRDERRHKHKRSSRHRSTSPSESEDSYDNKNNRDYDDRRFRSHKRHKTITGTRSSRKDDESDRKRHYDSDYDSDRDHHQPRRSRHDRHGHATGNEDDHHNESLRKPSADHRSPKHRNYKNNDDYYDSKRHSKGSSSRGTHENDATSLSQPMPSIKKGSPTSSSLTSDQKRSGYGLQGRRSGGSNKPISRDSLGPDQQLLSKKREARQVEKQRGRHASSSRRRMTEQERSMALQEMQKTAQVRTEMVARREKSNNNDDNNTQDVNDDGQPIHKNAKFLHEMAQQTHGVQGDNGMSLASRVSQNRNTNQRLHESFL